MVSPMPWDFWLIFLFLSIVLPWRGRARMRHFMAQSQILHRERIRLYASTILFQWMLAAIVAWRAFARGLTLPQLGLAQQCARRARHARGGAVLEYGEGASHLMLAYILRRLASTVLVMGIVAVFVFLLLHLSPGDPAAIIAGDNATAEQIQGIRKQQA